MREVKLPYDFCDSIVITCLKDDYETVKTSDLCVANAIQCLLRYYMVDSDYIEWAASVGIEVDE